MTNACNTVRLDRVLRAPAERITADVNPKQDLGFMVNRNQADLDGHVWEMMWMDVAAMPTGD